MRGLALLAVVAACAGAQPARIVSTAPSFTETLFAVGAGDRVVAVSTYCHFPAAAERLPRVGSYLEPNVEAIARLKPDLVVVHAESKKVVAQLGALGIRTLAVKNTTLEETLRSITEIGAAAGVGERAAALERKIRGELAAMEKRHAGQAPKKLLFVIGRTPGRLDGLIAVGKGSYLNELMRAAGGRNVLADSPVAYPKISLEGVLRLAPDVIVDMGEMAATVGVTEAQKRAVERLWRERTGVKAKVVAVAADIFVVPGPRVAEAAAAFEAMLR